MILCLECLLLGKVIDLYFLSIKAKNGIKNHKNFVAALRRTNLLFPPTDNNIEKAKEDFRTFATDEWWGDRLLKVYQKYS